LQERLKKVKLERRIKRGMEEVYMIKVYYKHMWKYHNATPYLLQLIHANKSISFFKMKRDMRLKRYQLICLCRWYAAEKIQLKVFQLPPPPTLPQEL
jgi:hypothetical protein